MPPAPADAAGESDAATGNGTAGAPLGDTLEAIRARVQALSKEAAEATALRAELAAARAHIAELEADRDAPRSPVDGRTDRSITDDAATEDPPVLALLGLAAAALLGFAAIGYWLWRLHRRVHRLVPDDLLDRLVRVEQAHQALFRLRADRPPDWQPLLHPADRHRDGGSTRGGAD
ncbi:MAG: hypothetical protein ICV73_27860 [Acetobacteraceae bacterium]|nr:hypothetical protein [Acetobacteraceae bacterium]